VLGLEGRCVLEKVVFGGGKHGRHGKKEREFHDGRAAQPENEPADDGSACARYAWHDRQALKQPDQHGLGVGDRGDIRDGIVAFLVQQLEHNEGHAAQPQRPEHDGVAAEQISLHHMIESEADQTGRDECRDQAAEDGDLQELAPIEHDHRADGPELDRNLEALLKVGLRKPQ